MAIPTDPAADLILIQPDLSFGRFDTVFNGPACTSHLREYSKRGVGGGKGAVGDNFAFILETAAEE